MVYIAQRIERSHRPLGAFYRSRASHTRLHSRVHGNPHQRVRNPLNRVAVCCLSLYNNRQDTVLECLNTGSYVDRLIIAKKERKLQKGSGFHLDIVLVNVINLMCGVIGAPWMSAATVRSVAHVSSLTVMSRTHAPGQKPHIIEVKGSYTP